MRQGVFFFTTPICHHIGGLASGIGNEKRNKRYTDWKVKIKQCLLTDEITFNIGNSKEFTKKLLDLMNLLRYRYKVKIQKTFICLYIGNEKLETGKF